MNAEDKIRELGLELPPAPKPVAVYKPVVVVYRIAYVSGHGPLKPDKTLITGKVGGNLNVEQGKAAARQVGLAIIATLKDQGLLARVRRVVKVLGMSKPRNISNNIQRSSTVAANYSPIFGDRKMASARAARSGWGRSRTTSRWKSKRSSN